MLAIFCSCWSQGWEESSIHRTTAGALSFLNLILQRSSHVTFHLSHLQRLRASARSQRDQLAARNAKNHTAICPYSVIRNLWPSKRALDSSCQSYHFLSIASKPPNLLAKPRRRLLPHDRCASFILKHYAIHGANLSTNCRSFQCQWPHITSHHSGSEWFPPPNAPHPVPRRKSGSTKAWRSAGRLGSKATLFGTPGVQFQIFKFGIAY